MANPFVHVELHTDGVDKAKAFYGELLDWKLEDVPMGDTTYTMVGVGDGTSGGMMTNPVPDGPSHWVAYVSVDNAATATEKAQELGAKIVVPKTEGLVLDHHRSHRRHCRAVGGQTMSVG